MKKTYEPTPEIYDAMTMTWWSSDVVTFCISNDYYTHGDCVEYERMLAFVRNNEPTKENVRKVATDIVIHSGLNFYDDNVIEEMVNNILENVISYS